LFVAVPFLWTIYQTHSWGAALALAGGLFVYGGIALTKNLRVYLAKGSLVLFLGMAVGLGWWSALARNDPDQADYLKGRFLMDSSWGFRVLLWNQLLSLPEGGAWMVGEGVGCFPLAFAQDVGIVYANSASGARTWHAHNLWLEILVEKGIVGLLLFSGLLASAPRAGGGGGTGAVGKAMLAALLLHGSVDVVFMDPLGQLFFWSVLGMLCVSKGPDLRAKVAEVRCRPLLYILSLVLGMVLFFPWIYHPIRKVYHYREGMISYGQGARALNEGRVEEARPLLAGTLEHLSLLDRGPIRDRMELNAREGLFWTEAGLGNLSEALARVRSWREPFRSFLHGDRLSGEAYARMEDSEQAKASFARFAGRRPGYRALLGVGGPWYLLLERRRDIEGLRRLLSFIEEGLRLRPWDSELHLFRIAYRSRVGDREGARRAAVEGRAVARKVLLWDSGNLYAKKLALSSIEEYPPEED
jgi:hypothetical protein